MAARLLLPAFPVLPLSCKLPFVNNSFREWSELHLVYKLESEVSLISELESVVNENEWPNCIPIISSTHFGKIIPAARLPRVIGYSGILCSQTSAQFGWLPTIAGLSSSNLVGGP